MVRALSFRRPAVILMDLGMVLAAYLAAFLLRFDFSMDPGNREILLHTSVYSLAAYFAAAQSFSLYRGLYYFSSFADLINITKTCASGGVLSAMTILFVRQGQFPRSVLLLHPLLAFLGICGVRFGIRLLKNYSRTRRFALGEARTAVLIGAGELGESVLRQMLKTPEIPYRIVGLIDDDPAKWGMHVHGHRVLGGRQLLEETLRREEVDEIVIAIASRRGEIIRAVMDVLRRLDLEDRPELKIAPSLDEMLKAPGRAFAIRQVKPADLLNRDMVRLDEARIGAVFAGKVVLVTGAGGTIGGELSRQVLKYGPEKIVLLESHATSLFYMDSELREKARGAGVVPVLGDIRDQGLIERVFKAHRPHVVLHAAAHKHVHQLESNVHEGIGNNILGTHNLAAAADKHRAETFLLVSTDKAVRPSSVMGATKRVAELLVRSLSGRSRTRFASVRFGNVLGSSGSVLPIFQDQIARGGPVTVTDPQVTRYFMTVEEAVGLILQAVSMSKGGEIFLLKMGTAVRIIDMAKNLILLSGLEPGKDIEIRVTGLRPGEKMEEELVEDLSTVRSSEHADIMRLTEENGIPEDLPARILDLEITSRGLDPTGVLRRLQDLVPSFQPSAAHRSPPVPGSPEAAGAA